MLLNSGMPFSDFCKYFFLMLRLSNEDVAFQTWGWMSNGDRVSILTNTLTGVLSKSLKKSKWMSYN